VQISLNSPKGAISALSEFLRCKCDDKYTIFGCEYMTLGHISAERLVEFFQFCGSSALKKELIAHFSAFLANCLGDGQILQAQNGKY